MVLDDVRFKIYKTYKNNQKWDDSIQSKVPKTIQIFIQRSLPLSSFSRTKGASSFLHYSNSRHESILKDLPVIPKKKKSALLATL